MVQVECPACRYEFDDRQAEAGCRGCGSFGGGCNFVKCPNCGFEMSRSIVLAGVLRQQTNDQ